MADFPSLKTGAVMQCPAQKEVLFSTSIVRFLNGSEQRFRQYPTALHRWMVRLDLLDEDELHRLREFYRTQEGGAQEFGFTDPWDGSRYGHCSLEDEQMSDTLSGESHGKTSLVIRENRS